jgi:hypothetical protein
MSGPEGWTFGGLLEPAFHNARAFRPKRAAHALLLKEPARGFWADT